MRSLTRWSNAAGEHAPRPPSDHVPKRRDLTIRIVGSAESRRLNRTWRGKDKPTNVLSFPADEQGCWALGAGHWPDEEGCWVLGAGRWPDEEGCWVLGSGRWQEKGKSSLASAQRPAPNSPLLLGDLAICAPVVAREAREQGKPPRAHWAHMVIHGVLHLLGYDHESDRDARAMATREAKILAQFGYPNPYEQ